MVSQVAWGIPPEDVEAKHRTDAKVINFGLLYGMGDEALAAKMHCSKAQAGRIREAILGTFRRLDKWCHEQLSYARKYGHIWTWWDGKKAHRRPLIQVADQDDYRRSVAEHGSWNTPVQGTASHFCIASLAECVQWIEEDGIDDVVKLVLTVHDSLMFEVRDDMVDETIWTARAIMTGWNSLGVPLVVDAKTGRSWGSMEDYEYAA